MTRDASLVAGAQGAEANAGAGAGARRARARGPGAGVAARAARLSWAGVAAVAALAATWAPAALAGGAYTPGADTQVLQSVPSARDPAWQRIADLRRRAAADPRDVRAADALARAYLDYGRAVGDARYAGYAEAVLAPWSARADAPAAVLVTQASVLQYRHDFGPARALLAQAVAADRGLAQAWLTLAALDLVEGEPAAAAERCRRAARQGGLALANACSAAVRLATGDAAQARALVATLDAEALPPPVRAWSAGLAADAAQRLGRWDEAEAAYRRGLVALPGDNFLLVGYADFLLDRGRARDVLALLAGAADSDTAYLRLAVANVVLRTPDAARYRWTMAARLAAYAQRGDATAEREEARFHLEVAGDPAAALAAAQRNFGRQRELQDARLLLASALAAGRPQAARPALDFIARTGLAEPRLDALVERVRRELADGQTP